MSDQPADRSSGCGWTSRVPDYLRSELGEDERDVFEAHLDSCEECRGELGVLSQVTDWLVEDEARLQKSDPWQLSRERADRIMAGLERFDRPSVLYAAALFRRRGALAVGGLLLLGLGVFVAVRSPSEGPPAGGDGETGGARSTVLSQDAEAALARAQAWLLSTQHEDGGWDPAQWKGDARYRVSLSALVLLALETGNDAASQAARVQGVRYLLGRQGESGLFGEVFRGAIYNHGLATLVVLRAYAAGNTLVRRDAVARAVKFLRDAQITSSRDRDSGTPDRDDRGGRKTADGAWGYLVDDTVVANESISFWALESLVEARRQGWEEVSEDIERGLQWLSASNRDDIDPGWRSDYTYRGRGGHVCQRDAGGVYGALSLLLRQEVDFAGPESTRRLHRAVDRLLRAPTPSLESMDFYEVYLYSQALSYPDVRSRLRVRGVELSNRSPSLPDLRRAALEALLDRQVVEGPLGGSWEPSDRWGHVGGRLYSTALATLTLRGR